jgi:hypothetical protein
MTTTRVELIARIAAKLFIDTLSWARDKEAIDSDSIDLDELRASALHHAVELVCGAEAACPPEPSDPPHTARGWDARVRAPVGRVIENVAAEGEAPRQALEAQAARKECNHRFIENGRRNGAPWLTCARCGHERAGAAPADE